MQTVEFRPNPDVIDTVLDDDEATLMHLGTKSSFALNRTGLRIWNLLKEGCRIDHIIEKIHQEFQVERDQAGQDVNDLIERMLAFKLITPIKTEDAR